MVAGNKGLLSLPSTYKTRLIDSGQQWRIIWQVVRHNVFVPDPK